MPIGTRGGVSFGRYEILAELGRGGMGVVYQAHDPRINRLVAIKTVSVAGLEADEQVEYRERFFREAQAAGRLSHPGIVTIFDVGEEGTTRDPYIVMEYVPGQSLKKLLSTATRGLPCDTALRLIEELAEGLGYAHAQGVVHRDIKPANVIVTEDGHAKLTDFGIAKMDLTTTTPSGELFGTPAYMSPEQLRGATVDGRSDLFSLGVVLYTLLTGHRPFQGDGNSTVQFKVMHRTPLPAATYNIDLPPQVDSIISRAMAKDPGQRYQTGAEMAAGIRQVRQELGSRPSAAPAHLTAKASQILERVASLPATPAPTATNLKPRTAPRIRGSVAVAKMRLQQLIKGRFPEQWAAECKQLVSQLVQPWREDCRRVLRELTTTTGHVSLRWYVAVVGSVLFIIGLDVIGSHHQPSRSASTHVAEATATMPSSAGAADGLLISGEQSAQPDQKRAAKSATPAAASAHGKPAVKKTGDGRPARGKSSASSAGGSAADLSAMTTNSLPGLETEASAAPQSKPVAYTPTPHVAPATLELGVEHQLAEGTMTVWVDGAKVYSDSFHGDVKKRLGIFKKVHGAFAHDLTLTAGKHRVRVRVQSADERYDQSKVIAGNFPENGKLVLSVKCERNKDMEIGFD
ncbi:MAG TPA: serine/threonine-protein kinase [Terriglobales bacterium]|nr:serine/threonine-protein kinase [Terriglobales bacterium]